MATLMVKNVPEPLIRRLKRQATVHRRSLSLEAIACLDHATRSMPVDSEILLARARSVRVRHAVRVTDRLLARLRADRRR